MPGPLPQPPASIALRIGTGENWKSNSGSPALIRLIYLMYPMPRPPTEVASLFLAFAMADVV